MLKRLILGKKTLNFSFKQRYSLQILFLSMLFTLLMGCTSQEHLNVTITDLPTCTGWDDLNTPIGVSQTFSTDEAYIYACGKLDVSKNPITLPINWYYEDKLIYREVLSGVTNGHFYSLLDPEQHIYAEGKYRFEVIIYKTPQYGANFQIVNP